MSYQLGWTPDEPTARGVAKAVSRAIHEGTLAPGTKLPPIRAVAKQLGLSTTTINAAWNLLNQSGVIRTDGRRGTTVADLYGGLERYRRALNQGEIFRRDLSNGIPDSQLLPTLDVAFKHLTTTAIPGGYLDPPIVPELVDLLRHDWPYAPDRFMIFDGALDALDMTIRTLVRFGDRVIVEDPAFPLLLDELEASGTEVVGVPIDDHGILPRPLAEAVGKPAAALFLQPRAHNPTGATMTPERANQLVNIIRKTNTIVVEDDSNGAIANDPAISLGQWIPEQTVHIRSFSKSHGPDLRLAAMSASADTIQEMSARRQLGQGWSSRLLQQILVNLLTHEKAIEQVAYARQIYAHRRKAMVQQLASRGIRVAGTDGFNIWVPVANEAAALVRLASQGIGAAAGTPFVVSRSHRDHIRVTVSTINDDYETLANTIADAAAASNRGRGR